MPTFHEKFMKLALKLAERGRWRVSPNPLVGCVMVRGGRVITTGWHRRFGGDHAEIVALRKLRFKASGTTLYVNLEPCAHFGKTPPCVDRIIQSGVQRVVIGMKDPNPLTCGKSIRKLKRARVKVIVGVCKKEARALNRAFVKNVTQGLPWVVVKVAQSLDGKITVAKGTRTRLTGRESFEFVQNIRSRVDAVLVGRGTVDVDDPLLNVRNKNRPQPKRVILDTKLKTSSRGRLFHSHGGPVILVCGLARSHPRVRLFQRKGVQVLCLAANGKKYLNWRRIFKRLYQMEIGSVLVEGGAEVYSTLIKTNLVDEWLVFVAPKILGHKGVPALSNSQTMNWKECSVYRLGQDILVKWCGS